MKEMGLLKRSKKKSFSWYKKVIASNGEESYNEYFSFCILEEPL